jgi:hypothetical protein
MATSQRKFAPRLRKQDHKLARPQSGVPAPTITIGTASILAFVAFFGRKTGIPLFLKML